MKKFILRSSVILLLFTGCDCNHEKKQAPSIPDVKKNDTSQLSLPMENDANTQAQDTAFNSIKFGISKEQYRKVSESDTQQIGLYNFILVPKFSPSDSLYELWISSPKPVDWDTSIAQLRSLETKIFQTYKTSEFPNESYTYLNSKEGKIQVHRRWTIGNKHILVGSTEVPDQGRNYEGAHYLTVCKILRIDIKARIPIQRQMKEDSIIISKPGKF